MRKMDIRTKRKLLKEFLEKNGCGVDIDFKGRNIFIPDGGLWSIEKKKVKVPKLLRFEKTPEGNYECVFSKKQFRNDEEYKVWIWVEELRDTINYLKRLDKLLIKMGYDTNKKYKFKGDKNDK